MAAERLFTFESLRRLGVTTFSSFRPLLPPLLLTPAGTTLPPHC